MSSNKKRKISKNKRNQRHKTIKTRYPKKGAIECIANEIDNIIVYIDDGEVRIQGKYKWNAKLRNIVRYNTYNNWNKKQNCVINELFLRGRNFII